MTILPFVHNEVLKVCRSTVFWVVLAVFSILPLMVGLFSAPGTDWETYFSELLTSIGSLLMVGFSFTSAWVFGREYTDNTIKELLVKPISKSYSILSKFIVITLWNGLLAIFAFAVVVGAGVIIDVSGNSIALIVQPFWIFIASSLLMMAVNTVSALLANVTKGYLAPIGLMFVIVIISNIVVQLGIGPYFPWTIPILLLAGADIGFISLLILAATAAAGFLGTIAWWKFAEHK